MKFYVAINSDLRHHLCATQADAQKINKEFETIEVPTDKPALMDFIQSLLVQIDTLTQKVDLLTDNTPKYEILPPPPLPNPAVSIVRADQQYRNDLEQLWPDLPLAFRTDLCCLLLEEIRSKLK